MSLTATANGLGMQPGMMPTFAPEVVEFCDPNGVLNGGMCTVVGHWWLDMDDPANAALLGVPITVTLLGGAQGGGGGGPVDMLLHVRLEKK